MFGWGYRGLEWNKMIFKVLVKYSKTLLPSNEASKLIYCSKNCIRIRELDVFHFFLFLSMFVLVYPYCTNFFQKVLTNMD